MIMKARQLRNLPVETRSGQHLGRLVDVELDVETQTIVTFIVRPGRLAQQLTRSELRIHRSQVVSLSPERLVVEDAAGQAASEPRRARPGLAKDVAPVIPAESS